MINKLQSVSFRSLYYPPHIKFTDAQYRTIEDIKANLGDKLQSDAFFISPAKCEDAVELYHLSGYRQGKTASMDNYEFKELIGVYDQGKPYKAPRNKKNHNLLILGLIALGSIAVCGLTNIGIRIGEAKFSKNILVKNDSINNLKDTLKLIVK